MSSSYPISIKVFAAIQDLATIEASDINNAQDEIASIEATLAPAPYTGTPYASLSEALSDLYENKSDSTHGHTHSDLSGLTNNAAHPQYMLKDGSTAFTGPVTGVNATTNSQLATLGQLLSQGFVNFSYVDQQVNAQVGNLVQAVGVNPALEGSFNGTIAKLIMGTKSGTTDSGGNLNFTFSGLTTGVQTIILTRNNQGSSLGTVPALGTVTLTSAQVTFFTSTGSTANSVAASYNYIVLGS